jgi:hypothetical protein
VSSALQLVKHNSSDVTSLSHTSIAMPQSPPLTGLRVLEFAGLAPGTCHEIRLND